ncbi:RAMP superfamily CRISPR-associated protein [Baaleninema sp.]|uniref:RAMP superfamily CRISPR-associated protein n=1 Tax=Baaleninema sp. TaxID=3101197 RepID=UPI003D03DDB1
MNYQSNVPKPYDFVSLPQGGKDLKEPAGHKKYRKERIHGVLHLELTVGTALHVSTGAVMMGSDVNANVPLIKTMLTDAEKRLIIPGSSLKGTIRSVYEALTKSCVCKVKTRGSQKTKNNGKLRYDLKIPNGYKECKPRPQEIKERRVELCPACRVFGALGFQGLLEFSDATVSHTRVETGFMPSLYEPQRDCKKYYINEQNQIRKGQLDGRLKGRKFYYHGKKAVSGGQKGIPVQQASQQYVFETQLPFKNLTLAELGTLLVALGQDVKYPFALKVGAGKPIGMGSMTVTVKKLEKPESMCDRYLSYTADIKPLRGEELQQFVRKAIAEAKRNLVQLEQLKQLQAILSYPTDRQPPTGNY